jgi:hypothetical protein
MSVYWCARQRRELAAPCGSCYGPKFCEAKTGGKGVVAGKPIQAAGPDLVTVRDIPIVMAGVEYKLASGPATFTPEDIMDFVASQDDPAIVPPRLKIGHTSVLSTNAGQGILKDGDDGVPALGKFINIRFDPNTIMAVGDAAGVPRWLAEIMPIAYPNRSIEGFQNALTNSGHTWGLVVHAVALLGVVWPGCSTLEDLPLLYSSAGPDDIEVRDENGEEVDVTAVVARRPASGGTAVSAQANVDDVRRAYYESLNADQAWWWIRAIYVDPNELIVMDDDSGDLFRVPFAVNGDEVEFSDPQKVKIQYVDAAGSQVRANAQIDMSGRQVAVYASRAESRPGDNNEGESMTPDQIRALRARLGLTEQQLPDNATQAQLTAAGVTPQLCATLGITAEEQEGGSPAAPDPAAGTEPEAGTEEEHEEENGAGGSGAPANDQTQTSTTTTQAGSPPPGMVMVPATEWQRVQQGTQAALQRAEQDEEQRRDTTLAAATREGRIRPADVPSYRNMHASAGPSRDMFYQLLTQPVDKGGLAAGLVPVSERGEVPAGDASGAASASDYDPNWLTASERKRIDGIKAGTHEPERVLSDVNTNNGNGQLAGAR